MPITFSATNKVDSPSFKPATYSDQYAPVFKKIKMEGDLAVKPARTINVETRDFEPLAAPKIQSQNEVKI